MHENVYKLQQKKGKQNHFTCTFMFLQWGPAQKKWFYLTLLYSCVYVVFVTVNQTQILNNEQYLSYICK